MATLTLTPSIYEITATVSGLEYIATYDRQLRYTIAKYDVGSTLDILWDLIPAGTVDPESSVTFENLDPGVHYLVNCEVYRTSDSQLMWLGVEDTTTLDSKLFFEIESIGTRNVSIHLYDPGEIAWGGRLDIYEYTSQTEGRRVYRGPWTSFDGDDDVIIVSDDVLTPNTLYLARCGYTKNGTSQAGLAYDIDHTSRTSIEFTTKSGGVHIYTTEWKDASVWIWCTVDGVTGWHETSPYIYSGGWKQTI